MARLADLPVHELPTASVRLKGNYFLAVQDKLSGDRYVFVDGSGLFHAFCSDAGVSTSFLDLVAIEKLGTADLNPEAVVEFLHFGYLSFGKTFFDKIQKLQAEQIVKISPNGKISIIPKPPSGIECPPCCSFEEWLQSFVVSVSSEQISLDLTGGIDSRLLAVALQYLGLRFEVAVSGMEDSTDVAIATQVADRLGLELRITRHNADDFASSLPHMFRFCDGLFDIFQSHPSHQMQSERVRRGITLMLTGVGGELFKDFWWLQDFPLYSRPRPNLERLYNMRMVPIPPEHAYLSEPYAEISRRYGARFVKRLSEYAVKGNTQTYDQIYYRVKMRDLIGRFISNHIRLLPCYAPYLEPSAASIGYHLPRRDRFFENFHRRNITHYSPDAARIRTTQSGITVSSEPSAVAGDLYKYLGNKGFRLARKAAEKMFKRRFSKNIPTSPQLYATMRRHEAAEKAVDRLREFGIIARHLKIEGISDGYLGRTISLAMLLEWIESRPVSIMSETAEGLSGVKMRG